MWYMDLSRHNIGRYKNDLRTEDIAAIEHELGEWMVENGYL